MPTGDPILRVDARVTNTVTVIVDPDKYDNCTLSREAIAPALGEGQITQLNDAMHEPSDSQSETETRSVGKRRSRVYPSEFTSVRIPTYHRLQSMLIVRGSVGALYVPWPLNVSNCSLGHNSQDINEAANLCMRLTLR